MRYQATTIHGRILGLLKRRGLLKEPEVSRQLSALEAISGHALQPGRRERAGPALSDVNSDGLEKPAGGISASFNGVNVYASAPLDKREDLEKLSRHLLRGPFSAGRLKERPDGMLTYRLKKPDRRGNTVLVLSPVELLARLASLIPAPNLPTRRYFGILAPGAKARASVIPKPKPALHSHGLPVVPPRPTRHRVPWSDLLKRVWNLDALRCAACGKTMVALAVIQETAEIARYLAHAGLTAPKLSSGPPVMAA